MKDSPKKVFRGEISGSICAAQLVSLNRLKSISLDRRKLSLLLSAT